MRSVLNLLNHKAVQLALVGMSALFWELALIRWLSATIRVIAYFQNFVLIAAFFGMGAGALLARFKIKLHRGALPAIVACGLVGLLIGSFAHHNPLSGQEFIWKGTPLGIVSEPSRGNPLSFGLILLIAYTSTAGVFVIFGQWIGQLFKTLPALKAYSVEVGGSIAGILLFALMSWLQTSPLVWFAVGTVLLLLVCERSVLDFAVTAVSGAVLIVAAITFVGDFTWSPYYKIRVEPINRIINVRNQQIEDLGKTVGRSLSVNDDYHQMMLDLGEITEEEGALRDFQTEWAALYDFPYQDMESLPEGPILIVGAGTGNDVAAALRNTDRDVYAVEIDPVILGLGKDLHAEQPYASERVTVVVNDARSFFQHTDERFALVVFGFLDSHAVLSSFSSVRLDNFVYTLESMQRVRQILLPGGRAELTFASNYPWIHRRIVQLMDAAFDEPTKFASGPVSGYANGIVYSNVRSTDGPRPGKPPSPNLLIPTDDWPFLYLRGPTIPAHYIAFMLVVLFMGVASLLFLPRGQRRIRLPFFLLGAAFFLIETSNVVSLSLLYGSTWYVNVLVFTGILVLVLGGNLTSFRLKNPNLTIIIVLLALNVVVAYVTPTSALLALPGFVRAVAAVAVFLGPVYFAALVFAILIKDEPNLYQAYGSNVLGAVLGGVCEYFSLMFGFKFLLAITLAFYLLMFLLLRSSQPAKSPA